ncbi:MAG: T9SS type A sorting domain-containing protein [Ignavibacteriae bacterium]|nr:T9SS type A sorting domain-containing protein [Ignavibacteriota bacterium]
MLFDKKKIIIAFSISLLFLISELSFSQNWNLQYSGTTKKLYSISAADYYSWICGDSGTVLRTSNNGVIWINLTGNGIPVNLKLIHIFSHKYMNSPSFNERRLAYVTGSDNSGSYIYMTSNFGINWNLVHTLTGTGAKFDAIWFKDTLNGIAIGEPIGGRWQIWRTTNKGVNWDSAGLFLNGVNYTGFANNLQGKQTSYRDSTLYFGATYNGTESMVFRSTNFGKNWNIIIPGINHPMTGFSYVNTGTPRLFIGGNKYFSISSNGGTNWITSDSNSFASTMVCSVSDGYSSPSFLMKTDSLGWQTVFTSWTYSYYYAIASGLRGINYINGYNWVVFLVGDSGKVYQRGILYPLVKKEENSIPENYSLSQNYPNPFNPSTIIRFQIKESGFITLKVFDILGKEIATLVSEKLQPGFYEVPFSITQFSNNHLPSGVYFYKLSAGDYSETKKMMLIK